MSKGERSDGGLSNPPRLVIVGGPNGAGKTTLVLKLMEVWQVSYLGADRVAEELGLGSMGADAIRAGREFVEPETTTLLDEIGRLSQVAVRDAREENRRRGIPNVQVEDGWIVEEMPDGTVKRRRKLPLPTKPVKHRKS